MKKSQFATLAKQLDGVLPRSVIVPPMIAISPMKPILRALFFDSHRSSADLFYVWAFVLPLWVPQQSVNFNLGKRLCSPDNQPWDINDRNVVNRLRDAIERDAAPLLSREYSTSALRELALTLGVQNDPHTLEALAYESILEGQSSAALSQIDSLMAKLDTTIGWQRSIELRLREVRDLLQHGVTAAQELLEKTIRESANVLHIPASG